MAQHARLLRERPLLVGGACVAALALARLLYSRRTSASDKAALTDAEGTRVIVHSASYDLDDTIADDTTDEVIRAALDIGSGQHKLCVAAVDAASGVILRIIHSEQRQVLLNHALLQAGGTGADLNGDVLERSWSALAAFKAAAVEAGATQFSGVCTAVFRRAANGEAHLARVNSALGLNLRLVSQRLEGELGYLSATSSSTDLAALAAGSPNASPARVRRLGSTPNASPLRPRRGTSAPAAPAASPLRPRQPSAAGAFDGVAARGQWGSDGTTIAWDSGGGSYQISAMIDGRLRVWEGPVGDSNVAGMLLQIQGRSFKGAEHGRRSSPNPVSEQDVAQLVAKLEAELPSPPPWLKSLCASGEVEIIGFGERTSLFALASELHGDAELIDAGMVWSGLKRCLNKSDAQLLAQNGHMHEEEDLALPKLCLMHTLMARMGVKEVRYVRTMGNCEGVLRCAELWV